MQSQQHLGGQRQKADTQTKHTWSGANLKLRWLGVPGPGHSSRRACRNVDNSAGTSSPVKSVGIIRGFGRAGPPGRSRTPHPAGRVMLSLFFTILSFTCDLSAKSADDKCTRTSCSVAGDKQHTETSRGNKTSLLWDTPEFHNLLHTESELKNQSFKMIPRTHVAKMIWPKSADVKVKCIRHKIHQSALPLIKHLSKNRFWPTLMTAVDIVKTKWDSQDLNFITYPSKLPICLIHSLKHFIF